MVTISEAIATAFQAYRTGNWVEAEWICQQLVQQQPACVPALHLLGVIAYQTSRLESAIAHFEAVIAHDPNHFEAHSNLAVALQDRGNLHEAAVHFQRSLVLNPNHAPTHFNLGNLYTQQRQWDQAVAQYQQAIALNPGYAKAYTNLGHALREQGNLESAVVQYQQAARLTPNDAQAYSNLGNALQAQGQFAAAIAQYQMALSLQPSNAETYFNLGNALSAAGASDAAIQQYQQAIALNPNRTEAYNNLAVCLQDQRQLAAAIDHFRRALDRQPENFEAHNNLGTALYEMNALEEAIAQYQQAIQLNPQFAEAHLNLSMALLALGDLRQGFEAYEWRWQCQEFQPPELPGIAWDGSYLNGRTLLLYAEQGLGDAIQFIRYVPQLALPERSSVVPQILVECPNELCRLFATVPGVAVIPRGTALPPFDVHLPLMSLPRVMGTTLDTIPDAVPYLSPPIDPVPLPAHDRPTLKVGIVWASGSLKSPKQLKSYRNRTVPLPILMEALDLPHVDLYSLQVGPHVADLDRYRDRAQLHDLSPRLHDLADTAGAIAQLDLVISVDTAVAHLAGALAKPVWVLLPFSGDWRWLLHRDTSPWYPTMRLFRQDALDDWASAVAKLVTALGQQYR